MKKVLLLNPLSKNLLECEVSLNCHSFQTVSLKYKHILSDLNERQKQPETLLKKRLRHREFPVSLEKLFKAQPPTTAF